MTTHNLLAPLKVDFMSDFLVGNALATSEKSAVPLKLPQAPLVCFSRYPCEMRCQLVGVALPIQQWQSD